MRSLVKQRQFVWFTKIEEVQDGIDTVKRYAKPEKHKMTVSATSGTPEELAAGIVPNYDRYITSYDRDFHPEEGNLIFVDVVPLLDADGNLVMADDEETPVTPPDYVLKKIVDTKMGEVARYGIKKRDGGE